MRRLVGMPALLALAFGLLPAAAHNDQTRPYAVGGDVLIVRASCEDDSIVPGVGGVCFNLTHGSGTMDLSVTDQHGLKVGVLYETRPTGNDTPVSSGQFCGLRNNVVIPPLPGGAQAPLRLLMWLATGSGAAFGCGAAAPGTYAPATTGTAKVHYDS